MLSGKDFENLHLILSCIRWDLKNKKWLGIVRQEIDRLRAENAQSPEAGADSFYNFVILNFLYYFQRIEALLQSKRFDEVFALADEIHEIPNLCIADLDKAALSIAKYNYAFVKKAKK